MYKSLGGVNMRKAQIYITKNIKKLNKLNRVGGGVVSQLGWGGGGVKISVFRRRCLCVNGFIGI